MGEERVSPQELLTEIIEDLIGAAKTNRQNLLAFASQRYQSFVEAYDFVEKSDEPGESDSVPELPPEAAKPADGA